VLITIVDSVVLSVHVGDGEDHVSVKPGDRVAHTDDLISKISSETELLTKRPEVFAPLQHRL
jgi:hypothetical protein